MSVAASVGPFGKLLEVLGENERWIAIQGEAKLVERTKSSTAKCQHTAYDRCELDARFGCCYLFQPFVSSLRALHLRNPIPTITKSKHQKTTLEAPSARLAAFALSLARLPTCPHLCGAQEDVAKGVEYSSFSLRKAHCCYLLALIAPLPGAGDFEAKLDARGWDIIYGWKGVQGM